MPGFSGIFYAYVLLNVTLYRKLKRKGERMPEFIWLIIGAVVGIALGFVVTRYLVNASTKRAAQEAESVVNDAKRQAETHPCRASSSAANAISKRPRGR